MISVIVSWPDGLDFPVFRAKLPELLKHVGEVVISFNRHGHTSLRKWLKDHMQMDGVVLIDGENAPHGGDWRNKSTNAALDVARGDMILSLEQDFLIYDYDWFFGRVRQSSKEIVGFRETNRLHPAFLLVSRRLLDSTHKDFSVMGTGQDHFAAVSSQLLANKYDTLYGLGLTDGVHYKHLRGLSDNYFAPEPYFDLPSFCEYNQQCMELDIPMSEYWNSEMERCAKKCGY